MVTVSEKAKDKIIELRQKDGLTENFAIRVAVQGGGCSGLMYDLQFDTAQQPSDHARGAAPDQGELPANLPAVP